MKQSGLLPVVLTIAGSDPSGGAGIQADLKVFHQFGVYGEAVITVITVQNTLGVSRVENLAPDLVKDQIIAVLEDIPPQAAKTGALGDAELVCQVAKLAREFRFPLVVDPVLISKNGATLLDRGGREALIQELLPAAFLVTPNLDEAAELTGRAVTNLSEMRRAADDLHRIGCRNVLVKGGHLAGDAVDLLSTGSETFEFPAPRHATPHTHGSGCALSAAITALLARGYMLREAVAEAKAYVTSAILHNPGLGHGSGPLNHWAGRL